MADDPKLIVALEARLDRFEKQLRQAGLIAEREMKAIEDRTSNITLGVTLGNLISKGIEAAIKGVIESIKESIEVMKELGSVAKKTAVSFEDIQRVGFAAAASGISQIDTLKALNSIGSKMAEINRGETELSKFLDANNAKYRERNGLAIDANKALDLAAQLMAKAGNEFDKEKIAQLFGLTNQWVSVLGKGTEEFRRMKAAANIDPELAKNTEATVQLFRVMNAITAEFANWGGAFARFLLEPLAAATTMASQFAAHFAEVHKNNFLGETFAKSAKSWAEIAKTATDAVEKVNRTRLTVTPQGKGSLVFPQADTGEKDALTRQEEALSKQIALRKAEIDLIGQGVEKQEEARQLALLTEAAKRAGAETQAEAEAMVTAEMRKQAAFAGELQAQLARRTASFNEMMSISKELGSTLSDGMKGLVLEGKKFDEVLRSITNRLASKAFDKFFDVLFASQSGGTGSIFTQLLGLSGTRMAGGPVTAGGSYMVGEHGPELFTPNRSGMIVPNTALGGSRATAINMGGFSIDARGATPGAADEIMRRLRAEMPGIAIASVAQAQRYGTLRARR